MFLEEMRQLGHEVVVLFGDFCENRRPQRQDRSQKTTYRKGGKENVKDWLKQMATSGFNDKKNRQFYIMVSSFDCP